MPATPQKNILEQLLEMKEKLEQGMAAAPKPGWWDYAVVDRISWEADRYQAAFTGFFFAAAKENKKVFELTFKDVKFRALDDDTPRAISLKKTASDFISDIRALELPEIFESKYLKKSTKYDLVFSTAQTVISVAIRTSRGEKLITLSTVSFDEDFVNKVRDIAEKYLETKSKKQDLYVLAEAEEGLTLTSIGRPGVKLERDNYSEVVVNSFDYIVKQFSSQEPFGRLSIVHGPPGTGKTRMLRAFIEEMTAEKNKFIFIQPECLFKYSMATIMTLLMEAVDDGSSATLLIEDADECLVRRETDNMTAISTLLNLADGFIGNMLNLRIIATTNAGKLDIDSALKRPGRLCKVIDVNQLEPDRANRIFERLVGTGPGPFDRPAVLAEIYLAANIALGTTESPDAELFNKSVGFVSRKS